MKNKIMLTIYTVCHFAVDLCCACIILGCSAKNVLFFFLLYNFCAFALQSVFGLLADRTGGAAAYACAGCLLVLCGAAFYDTPYICALLCGTGNALFHIGGGTDILHKTNGASHIGIFVSSGALGLFLGRRLTGHGMLLPMAVMLVSFLLIFVYALRAVPTPRIRFKRAPVLPVIAIFLVTALRSYAGFEFSPASGLTLIICVVLGKALGGVLSDKFGLRPVSVITLTLSLVLYICGFLELAMFFFNMTMPITLFALSRKLGRGFAFGTLCLALFVGFLPTALGVTLPISFPVLCILSVILLIYGVKENA